MKLAVVLLVACVACDRGKAVAPPNAPAPAPARAKAEHAGPIQWIADDWAATLQRARAEKKPIVIDAWTKWCHTCMSMQAFVLSDASMKAVADRFVWAALDYEALDNAAVVEKFPVDAFPTFLVIDAETETVAARWLGSASQAQFRHFLADGERAVQLAHGQALPDSDPLAWLVKGDRAAAAKRPDEAAAHYAKALSLAPADWPRRPDVLVSQISALADVDAGRCVELGIAAMDQTGSAASASDFAANAAMCSDKLPAGDPRQAKVREAAERRLTALVADEDAPLSADDRGDAWGWLAALKKERGDEAGARATYEARVKLLADAAAKAPDPASAMTFDWARADSYLALDRGQEAIDLLLARELALPQNYNPPAWLARVYFRQGRLPEARAAIDRALQRGDGPRKGSMFKLKADIAEKQGDTAALKETLEQQIAWYAALPASQTRPAAEKEARERLQKLGAPK
jgi:tetratricopeptide (TPR) repeat protein